CFFFFSSRRRHTRFSRDWSSDVCSSDLNAEYDSITGRLASEDQHLRGLIANANATLGALAARQHELQGTLDHAAGTLGSLDAGLQGEQGNLAAIFQKGPSALDRLQQAAVVLAP